MDIDKLHSTKDNVPRLFRNHRIKSQWGPHYYGAVKAAVFAKFCFPYTPMEPPATLSEEIVELDPLHVCEQCKDCFRFESSFGDHIKRRSWILGFWCHMCFITVCTHRTATGKACLLCLKKDSDKRAYLRTRGFTKNQKLGTMKVFYNQCQFFKHLGMHNCNTVDLGNLMLMPLPAGLMDSDWSLDLEIACEALLEHTFLSRVHINDWLKMNNLENTWWKLINDRNNDNQIYKVIKGYKGRQVFRTLEEFDHVADSTFIDAPLTESTCSFYSESPPSHLKDTTNGNSGSTSESEDNPCTSNGIAFIDCGEAAEGFDPEFTTDYVPRTRKTVVAKSSQQIARKAITVKDLKKLEKSTSNYKNVSDTNQKYIAERLPEGAAVQQYTRCKVAQPLKKSNAKSRKTPDTSNSPANNNSAKTTNNNDSEIMIIQDLKNVASTIDQFSPPLASNNNNNKLVVIEKDIDKILARNSDKAQVEKISCKLLSSNSDANVNVSLQTCDTKTAKQQIDGQIIVRKGKKYLIKKVENTTNNVNNSNLSFISKTIKIPENILTTTSIDKTCDGKAADNGVEQAVLPSNNIARPTFPAPSEVSLNSVRKPANKTPMVFQSLKKKNFNSPFRVPFEKTDSSKSRTLETILFQMKNDNVYMEIQLLERNYIDRVRNFSDRILSYSRQMIEDFERLDVYELDKRIDHLENVKEELRMVLSFMPSNVLDEKLKRVCSLQLKLQICRHGKFDNNSKIDIKPEKHVDTKITEWETEVPGKNLRCMRCNKPKKPSIYIPGFSKLPKYEWEYCLCYKYVCHECRTYEGSMARFVAHRNFHKQCSPYICPDCHTRFSSAVLLEVHTWTACFHTLRRRLFCCKICDIDGFRDMESITRHYVVMHSDMRTACEFCWMVFATYSECMEHYSEVHSMRGEPIRLVLCKISNVVVRWENYLAYLEDFRGIRKLTFFKCPFCQLVTVDNKHAEALLNRHLRSWHFESLTKAISKEAFAEIYKTRMVEANTKANKLLRNDDTVIPKIVNTRTISSEIFERGSSQDNSWSANPDELGDANVIRTNTVKDNDGKAKESLPKILNVISMANLRPSTADGAIILPTTSSESLPTRTVEIEDKKADQCKVTKEMAVEVDAFKFEVKYTEETEAAKTLGTTNNELVAPCIFEPEKLPSTDVNNACVDPPGKGDSSSKPEASVTSRIKVVDIRKICKPDVAPLIDAEMRDARAENTNLRCLISKPPPLVKIPQCIPETTGASETDEPNDNSENVARSQKHVVPSAVAKTRIAIHGTRDGDVEYACHLCNERINTSWPVVRKHFDERHSNECTLTAVTPRASRMSSDFINGGYRALICEGKRKADSILWPSLFVSKRKRRWTTRKWQEKEKPVGLCVKQETAEDGEGNFKCKRCDQRCADMSDLREHIATSHRIKDDCFVCLECGENFMVTPSLQMHLKAFHGVEDPVGYMNENPSYAPGAGGDSEKGKTDNQCYVCKEIFEDKAAVDKHLRVHGMAFLNSKRIEARNAQKNPEKKITRDDKQVGVRETPKDVVKQEKPLKTILEKLNAAI